MAGLSTSDGGIVIALARHGPAMSSGDYSGAGAGAS